MNNNNNNNSVGFYQILFNESIQQKNKMCATILQYIRITIENNNVP